MATLERSYQLEQDAPRTSFNPSAIPSTPQFSFPSPDTTSRTSNAVRDETDLIELGEERLFSGSRNSARRDGESRVMGTSGQRDELLGSLGEARQAFVLALDSLLPPYLTQSPQMGSSTDPEAEAASPSVVPFTNPFVDPSAILAPFRRHSLAVGSSSATIPRQASPNPALRQSSDSLLSHLVQSLRQRTSSLPTSQMCSLEGRSPLVRRESTSYISPDQPLLDELHTQIELCAQDLSPTDAELARSLGSLLICIDQLASISVALNGLSGLEDGSEHRAVGAAREVEQAQRDLLWGRVDDLSERVRELTRQRAETARLEEEEEVHVPPQTRAARASLDTFHWSPKTRDDAWDAASLSSLPSYNQEHDLSSPNLPPGYFHEHQLLDEKADRDWDIKAPLSPRSSSQQQVGASTSSTHDQPTRRVRKVSSMQSEKMQKDLDSVSQAIERLYVVSPQLANQRVEPDRRVLRERQLAKLGNAIERLSQGRLDDQRAASLPSTFHEPETQAERSRREREAVDKLIERIDKAASRTLADQRVELNGKRRAVITESEPPKSLTALSDPREAKRREFILEHTGKGRLAGQDAILHSSGHAEPFPGPPPELSESITVSEFFSEERPQPRSAGDSTSSNGGSSLRKKGSTKNLFQPQKSGTEEATVGRKGSLRIGMLKGFGSRRGSAVDMRVETGTSRSPTTTEPREILAIPQFDWVTEESRNLGTLIVTFWPRDGFDRSPKDDIEIISVETDSIVVAPARGGPASRLSLPSRVIPQETIVTSSGVYHEVKLVTIPPSPTKSRADLEVHVPLSTTELRQSMPVSFACSNCQAELVDSSQITRYNALPSEHWAELLDAWMCHPDQTLSQDLVSKGKGIKPRIDEGLVGTSYVLFPRTLTKNWRTPEKAQPTRSPSDDNLFPARCNCCSALVGYHVEPLSPFEADATSFRLLKYAAYPLLRTSSTSTDAFPEYNLSCHLTAELLETGQAHACHRFVLEDAEEEKPRLLLWFFNPAIRVSFSTSSSLASYLGPTSSTKSPRSTSSNSPPSGSSDLVSRSMNAVKVFYSVVSSTDDPHYHDFIENKTETVSYPLAIVEQLSKLLEASSLVYPPAKRRFGTFETGFLERI
ncbi:putative polyadenylation protein [Sporobolomyces salmoneus]|uniref:putative polyadenylation protein n=1 Tax=Sporobolomyces salmoneus TaxID=183962 RepID=UPI00316B4C3A